MHQREIRRNTDAEKASEVGKQSKAEKKSTTFHQRGQRALGVATMALLASAKMIEATNVDGNQVTKLDNQHSYNNPPEFSLQQAEQTERRLQEKMRNFPFHFNGPEEIPASEETPQSTTEIPHQGEQDKHKGKELIPLNEERMQIVRAVMEKAETDPEVRVRARKLLERLVPQRELATDTTSVVFVHGWRGGDIPPAHIAGKGSSEGFDCIENYWKAASSFLSSRGFSDLRFIKYYAGDTNCHNGNDEKSHSSDLHNPMYSNPCTNFHPGDKGSDGTNDESIYHISCLFSQYLFHNFGQYNRDVVLVGHSMGGLIIREAMSQMQHNAGKSPFPTTIGKVTDAITIETPHGGSTVPASVGCGGCKQLSEMEANSDLLSELSKNPQTSGGFTRWTVIGSECDGLVNADSGIDMHASHTVVYKKDSPDISCYDHTNGLGDASVKQDAHQYYCDTSDSDKSPCGINYSKWKSTNNGPRGLLELYNAIKS